MPRLHRLRRLFDSLENRRVPARINVYPVTVLDSVLLMDNGGNASQPSLLAEFSEDSSKNAILYYSTSNGSAKAGRDYYATKSSVTIPANPGAAYFIIGVKPIDVSGRPNEVFYVNLKASPGNTVNSRVAVTIVDDLPKPTVTVSDTEINENAKGGSTHSSVQVKLSNPTAQPIVVYYTTKDDTATSSGPARDYQAAKGSVTIKPGSTTANIPLTIYDRATTDKVFDVTITGTSNNAQVIRNPPGDQYGRVVIHDSKSTATEPILSISSPTVLSGDIASFDVTLSAPSTVPISVRYDSVDGTALAGNEYTAVNDVLTIPAGQTSATILVPTFYANFTYSSQFQLVLASPTNVTLASRDATATILDLTQPTASVANPATTSAPLPGTTSTVDFVVTLSASYYYPVYYSYDVGDPDGLAVPIYNETLTFTPDVTSLTVPVTLLAPPGNPLSSNDTVSLELYNPGQFYPPIAAASATITPPSI